MGNYFVNLLLCFLITERKRRVLLPIRSPVKIMMAGE